MSLRILLTGAAGFIGSNLYQRCLEEDIAVWGVDDFSNGHTEFLPKGAGGVWHKDFASEFVLKFVRAQRFTHVIHLAAMPRVSYSVDYPLETHDTNVTKTLKLMDACRGNVKRFIFASSSSVYGGADVLPTIESTIKDPKSPYALQKSQIEDYLRLYHDLYDFESVCLRFFNVFGKNQIAGGAYATAISAWLNAIKCDLPMRSDGGTQTRDMCHVDNVVDACVRAANVSQKLCAKRFNVACGDSISNNEILQYMLKRYPNATKVDAQWRVGDVMHTLADITSSKNELGYVPLVRVWDGIEKTCDWFDQNWETIKTLKQGV
jgi:UDP-N-acetylglucosamine 4-epimerase